MAATSKIILSASAYLSYYATQDVTFGSYCYCNGRGMCITDNGQYFCVCDSGYGGTNELGFPSCDSNWRDVDSKSFDVIRSLHIIFTTVAIFYAILNFLYFVCLFLRKSDQVEECVSEQHTVLKATLGRTSKVALSSLLTWLIFNWISWNIDPMSYDDILPYPFQKVVTDVGTTVASICTITILEHVLKFTNYSLSKLKYNDLIQKIHSSYIRDITIEQVILETSKGRNIFWISIGINVPLVCLQVIYTILFIMRLTISFYVGIAHTIVIGLLFISYTISTWLVWRHFISILPLNIGPRKLIISVFLKCTIVSTSALVNIVLAVAILTSDKTWLASYYYAYPFLILQYISVFAMISIFDPPTFREYLKILPLIGITRFSSISARSSNETTSTTPTSITQTESHIEMTERTLVVCE